MGKELLFFIIGFVVGGLAIFLIMLFRLTKIFMEAGELQVYFTDDGIFPVLNVSSEKEFEKNSILLKVRRYDSHKKQGS